MDTIKYDGKLVIEEAKKWIGTPFIHHASILGKGCDCVGFLVGIFKKLGYFDKNLQLEYYSFDWMLHQGRERLIDGLIQFSEIVKTEWKTGDILLFKFGRATSHAGLFCEKNLFIHSWVEQGVSYSVLTNSIWGERLNKVMRIKDDKIPVKNYCFIE